MKEANRIYCLYSWPIRFGLFHAAADGVEVNSNVIITTLLFVRPKQMSLTRNTMMTMKRRFPSFVVVSSLNLGIAD